MADVDLSRFSDEELSASLKNIDQAARATGMEVALAAAIRLEQESRRSPKK